VVGSANADLIVVVDVLPGPGSTVASNDITWVPGGKGANQAVAAARLGARTTVTMAVGTDELATIATRGLLESGIDPDGVRHVDAPTGVATVCVDHAGENLIVVAAGANHALRPVDVTIAPGTDAVLVSLEVPLPVAVEALGRAKGLGALAVCNAAPATPGLALADLGLDVLIVNEVEAAAVGLDPGDHDALADAARTLDTCIALTLGGAGALVAEPGGPAVAVPARPSQVVDTVGAGDCFAAALTVALAERRPLADAARWAVLAAGLAVERRGAQTGMPHRREVDDLAGHR
jgi:ribokinase